MKILLVDGNWYLHRAYNINPNKKEGVTNLFISMVCKDALFNRCEKLLICFDGDSVFRYKIYPNYKANRIKGDGDKSNVTVEDLIPDAEIYNTSLPFLIETLNSLDFPWVQNQEMEGDDIIRSTVYSGSTSDQFIIASKDKDQYQSLNSRCKMFISDGNNSKYIDSKDVKKITGVPVEKQVFYQTLLGDQIDNIKGIPGYGKIKVKNIVNNFQSVKEWIQSLEGEELKLITKYRDQLRLNNKLVKLRTDVPGNPKKLKKVKWKYAPKSMNLYLDFLYPKTKSLFKKV